jgi:hypothetical protein
MAVLDNVISIIKMTDTISRRHVTFYLLFIFGLVFVRRRCELLLREAKLRPLGC